MLKTRPKQLLDSLPLDIAYCLLNPFVNYEENKVLQLWLLEFILSYFGLDMHAFVEHAGFVGSLFPQVYKIL